MWVSKMTAAPKQGGWQLTGVGKDQGTYGAVVIAHNGKCANRYVLQYLSAHVGVDSDCVVAKPAWYSSICAFLGHWCCMQGFYTRWEAAPECCVGNHSKKRCQATLTVTHALLCFVMPAGWSVQQAPLMLHGS
jgi:hypothetical protein